MFQLEKPVSVIDRLQVTPGNQQAAYDLMTRVYAAHVASRELRLVGAWLAPPFDRPDAGSELTVIWEYSSLGALWAARMAEENDPVAENIWSTIETLTKARSRQIARPAPMQVPFPDDSGGLFTAGETGVRSIWFVRPLESLAAADQNRWITAAEAIAAQIPEVLLSRAGFHQEYSFMPGHFTWDLTLRERIDARTLLNALPAPAEIVDSVELGAVVNAGLRDPGQSGTKRTVLVRAKAGLDASSLAMFEEVLAATPRYITGIRNWRLSRVSSSSGPVAWTHCFEQEVADASLFVGAYLNHPYHWAIVERLFHPEAPERCTDAFCHSLYPITRSVLADLQMLAG
jgi:hypothetical protein